jgi:hypothetical protein
VQGAACTVTHILDNTAYTGVVLTVAPSSAPIFRYLDSASPLTSAGLTVGLYNSSSVQQGASLSTPLTGVTGGYLILPKDLDSGFSYLPLIRLTDTTMEIGDRSFSLLNAFNVGAKSAPILDLHAPPIGAISVVGDIGTKTHSIDLVDPKPPIAHGKHTIRLGSPTIGSQKLSTSLSSTQDAQLLKLLASIENPGTGTLTFGGARYFPLGNITTTGGIGDVVLALKVLYTASDYISVKQDTFVNLPAGAITDYGNKVDILPEKNTHLSTAGTSTVLTVIAELYNTVTTKTLLTGDFYVEVDLILT